MSTRISRLIGAAGVFIGTTAAAFLGGAADAHAGGNPGPQVSAVSASFVKPVTTYSVTATDTFDEPLTYQWSHSNARECGQWSDGTGATYTWSHLHVAEGGDCPEELPHPATVTVVVSDGFWNCSAVYTKGSAPGTGDAPGVCAPKNLEGLDEATPAAPVDQAAPREDQATGNGDDGGGSAAPMLAGVVIGVIVVGGTTVLVIRRRDDGAGAPCDCGPLLAELADKRELLRKYREALAGAEENVPYSQAQAAAAKAAAAQAKADYDAGSMSHEDYDTATRNAHATQEDADAAPGILESRRKAVAKLEAEIRELEARLRACGCEFDAGDDAFGAPQGHVAQPEPAGATPMGKAEDFFDAMFDGIMALDPNAGKVSGPPPSDGRPHTVSPTPLHDPGPSAADDPEYMKHWGQAPEFDLAEHLYAQRKALEALNPGVYIAPVSVFAPPPPPPPSKGASTSGKKPLIELYEEKQRMLDYIENARESVVVSTLDFWGLDREVNYANKVIERIETEIKEYKEYEAIGGSEYAACKLWWDREQQWQMYKYAIQHCFMEPLQFAFGVYGGTQSMRQQTNQALDNHWRQVQAKVKGATMPKGGPIVSGGAQPVTPPPTAVKPHITQKLPALPPLPPKYTPPKPPPVRPPGPVVTRQQAGQKVGALAQQINRAPGVEKPVATGKRGENCPYTSLVYAEHFRGRGAHVSPVAPPFKHSDGIGLLETHFGSKFKPGTPQQIHAWLQSKPGGTQGIVYVAWKNPNGGPPTSSHVFNAVNQDGHVFFVDAQTGRPFTNWAGADPVHTKFMPIP